MGVLYSDSFRTTLASGVAAGATSFSVVSAANAPAGLTAGAGHWCYLTIGWDGQHEIRKCTALDDVTFACDAFEGDWAAGTPVTLALCRQLIIDLTRYSSGVTWEHYAHLRYNGANYTPPTNVGTSFSSATRLTNFLQTRYSSTPGALNAATGEFTVPATGKWEIDFRVQANLASQEVGDLYVVVNNTTAGAYPVVLRAVSTGGHSWYGSGFFCDVADLSAGDTISIHSAVTGNPCAPLTNCRAVLTLRYIGAPTS